MGRALWVCLAPRRDTSTDIGEDKGGKGSFRPRDMMGNGGKRNAEVADGDGRIVEQLGNEYLGIRC